MDLAAADFGRSLAGRHPLHRLQTCRWPSFGRSNGTGADLRDWRGCAASTCSKRIADGACSSGYSDSMPITSRSRTPVAGEFFPVARSLDRAVHRGTRWSRGDFPPTHSLARGRPLRLATMTRRRPSRRPTWTAGRGFGGAVLERAVFRARKTWATSVPAGGVTRSAAAFIPAKANGPRRTANPAPPRARSVAGRVGGARRRSRIAP